MKAMLYPCPYTSVGCDIYNCRNRVSWYVGRPDGPASVTFKLCGECAKHLVATAPAELVDGGEQLKHDILTNLETQFEQKLAEQKAKYEEVAGGLQKTIGELIVKIKRQNQEAVEEKPEEEEDTEGAVFRCLECDKEFAKKQSLMAHMRVHKLGLVIK